MAAVPPRTPRRPGQTRLLKPPPRTPATRSPVKVSNLANLGPALTNLSGMTLYVLTTDTGGKSSCTADCVATWPPLKAAGTSVAKPSELNGALGAISRDDGTL